MKILLLTLVALTTICIPVYGEDADPADLFFMTEIYPPANYIENGKLKGASVEVLKTIWSKLDIPEQEIHVYPWMRGYQTLLEKKNHVLFSMSRSPSRETLFKWVGPIFRSRHSLIGLADANLDIKTLEDAKKYKIGALIGDISETSLLELGFPREKVESLTDIELNLKKLLMGRIDLICQSDESYRELARKHGQDYAKFKVYAIVNEMENFYAFNKETPDQIINQYQEALDSIEKTRIEIVNRYNMIP